MFNILLVLLVVFGILLLNKGMTSGNGIGAHAHRSDPLPAILRGLAPLR